MRSVPDGILDSRLPRKLHERSQQILSRLYFRSNTVPTSNNTSEKLGIVTKAESIDPGRTPDLSREAHFRKRPPEPPRSWGPVTAGSTSRAATSSSINTAESPKPLVLIVEDNPDTTAFITETLLKHHRIASAIGGDDGFTKTRKLRPDLIICDLTIPRLCGDTMIRKVRACSEFRSTPILALTTHTSESIHLDMLTGLVQDYVTQPFSASELRARVKNLLAARRQEEELRSLSTRLISAQESERRRIARELHDDFGQRLAALCMEISLLEERPPACREEVNQRIQAVGDSIARIALDIQKLSRKFHSSVLQSVGLEAAISSECMDFSEREHIPVEFVTEAAPESITEEISLCLYRVVQESLRNVAKHARADSVRVTLSGHAHCISLTVKDTGVGFDPERSVRGLGLISMRERVRSLDGNLTIRSSPGKGTELTLSVPIRGSDR